MPGELIEGTVERQRRGEQRLAGRHRRGHRRVARYPARAVPDDLTGTLVYLASGDSDFVTGQVIVVDGGSVTH